MAICPTPMELLKQAGGDTTLGFVEDVDCRGKRCWYCGHPITEGSPAVYWVSLSALHLHAPCAEHFGAHILKDGLVARLTAERDEVRAKRAATTQTQPL